MCRPKYNIAIPEPCHEDWAKMTPEEQGRHCKVCAKTVIDFSGKSTREVDRIIEENQGQKICGRFRSEQVQQTGFMPVVNRGFSSLRVFAMALFLVFGAGLFSCKAQDDHIVGDIAIEIPEVMGIMVPEPLDTLPIPEQDSLLVVPEVSITKCDLIKGEVIAEEIYVLGGPRFTRVVDTIPEVVHTTGEISVEEIIAVPPVPEDSSVQILKPEVTQVEFPTVEILPTVKAYPNPTAGSVTFDYVVVARGDASLRIFDLTGKLRREVFTIAAMHEGRYRQQADLSELPNGMYLAVLESGGQKVTVQLVLGK